MRTPEEKRRRKEKIKLNKKRIRTLGYKMNSFIPFSKNLLTFCHKMNQIKEFAESSRPKTGL